MEHRKNAVGTPCPPCESAPFLENRGQAAGPQGQAVPGGQGPAAPLAVPQKGTFGFAWADIAFALVFLAVGWLFWELQAFRSFSPAGLGTAVFCALYAGVVLCYLYLAGKKPTRESWFWLGVMLCLGLSYALPYGGTLLGVLHYLALLLVAQYWVLCAAGRLLKQGKTSNWLLLDLFNAGVILPWGNFMRLPAALWAGAKQLAARRKSVPGGVRKGAGAKRVVAVLGGVLAGLLCLCIVLPLLMQADAGFAALFDGFTQWVSRFVENLFSSLNVGVFLVKCVLAVPTALFLYGTVYGSVRGRRTCIYQKQEVCGIQRGLRVLPRATVGTALLVVCAV